jgi:hypothetical protein
VEGGFQSQVLLQEVIGWSNVVLEILEPVQNWTNRGAPTFPPTIIDRAEHR